MTVQDRLVWVTGACSGIGEALSYELSRRGADLVLSSNRPDALEDARQNCDRPEDHVVQPLDLTEPSTLRDAAERVHDDVGPVDILVNNAGIGHGGPAAKTDVDDVRQVMEINFFGTIQLTKAVLPRMQERQDGQIAVVSSIAGKVALPKASAYAASKHAVQAWFESLRAEVHDDGIQVTVACPGFTQTNIASNAVMADEESSEEVAELVEEGMPPGVCAEAVADAVEADTAEMTVAGWEEKLLVYMKRFTPSLFRGLARREA
jgi:short-subunit dehydrogenase